jgi:hypothetical protein
MSGQTQTPHPFTLEDVTFRGATPACNAATIPLVLLPLVTYMGMHLTEQQNGIKNETIGASQHTAGTSKPVPMSAPSAHAPDASTNTPVHLL